MTQTIKNLLDNGTRLTTNGTDIIYKSGEFYRHCDGIDNDFIYNPCINYRIYRDGMKADKPLTKLEAMSEYDTPVKITKTPRVIDWNKIDLTHKEKHKFQHSVPFDLAHLN